MRIMFRVVLVFFMLFCVSGGIGCLVNEIRPGFFPVSPSVRGGRWVEMVCAMVFYGMEVLGLIKMNESASSSFGRKVFIRGICLFVVGWMGHSVLYRMFIT